MHYLGSKRLDSYIGGRGREVWGLDTAQKVEGILESVKLLSFPIGERKGVWRRAESAGQDAPYPLPSALDALLKVTLTEMFSWHAKLWINCEPKYGAT